MWNIENEKWKILVSQYSRCFVFKERKNKDMFYCGVFSVISFNIIIVVNLLS